MGSNEILRPMTFESPLDARNNILKRLRAWGLPSPVAIPGTELVVLSLPTVEPIEVLASYQEILIVVALYNLDLIRFSPYADHPLCTPPLPDILSSCLQASTKHVRNNCLRKCISLTCCCDRDTFGSLKARVSGDRQIQEEYRRNTLRQILYHPVRSPCS